MRYQLLQIMNDGEHVIGEFDSMVEACDESYRRWKKKMSSSAYVVLDTEMNERWSYYEMIAGGFSNLCTETEFLQAKRFVERQKAESQPI